MEPHDDPEARIRELERPLADIAGTSELGATQSGGYAAPPTPPVYGPPPTPPLYGGPPTPPMYGAPFPTTPPKTTAGFRGWWIVLAGLVVGAVVLAAALAAVGAHMFSSRGPIVSFPSNRPTISRGTGPSASAPQSPGGSLSVTGIGQNKTIACNDSSVNVTGFSNTVVITGHCTGLTVSGSNNIVTVDAADTINAVGSNNKVTYHSGSPSVGSFGQSNVVSQG
jgi:Protein of unknown function (DUF3060)